MGKVKAKVIQEDKKEIDKTIRELSPKHKDLQLFFHNKKLCLPNCQVCKLKY